MPNIAALSITDIETLLMSSVQQASYYHYYSVQFLLFIIQQQDVETILLEIGFYYINHYKKE